MQTATLWFEGDAVYGYVQHFSSQDSMLSLMDMDTRAAIDAAIAYAEIKRDMDRLDALDADQAAAEGYSDYLRDPDQMVMYAAYKNVAAGQGRGPELGRGGR